MWYVVMLEYLGRISIDQIILVKFSEHSFLSSAFLISPVLGLRSTDADGCNFPSITTAKCHVHMILMPNTALFFLSCKNCNIIYQNFNIQYICNVTYLDGGNLTFLEMIIIKSRECGSEAGDTA
uniref:Uncharacterized protein n=1 Tax=Rhizophagus irregularis (strain DAOM 181602 / DAOM 197198 / MUCL 43194) TaxID=747089 RepID=U9TI55_RHIID